jgi:DNA-binding SARP family transcriptional activator
MEFRLLGPMEVLDGDEPVALGGPKQRALLARLLLSPNRTIAIDRLVDDVWGEEAPESATKMVQIYVSQLRKLLGA